MTRYVTATTTVPVYGWKLVGSQTYAVAESHVINAQGTMPAGAAATQGSALVYTSGAQVGQSTRQTAWSRSQASRLSHSFAVKTRPGLGGIAISGGSGVEGTWYASSGGHPWKVVVSATEVSFHRLYSGYEGPPVHVSRTLVHFGTPTDGGQEVVMTVVAGASGTGSSRPMELSRTIPAGVGEGNASEAGGENAGAGPGENSGSVSTENDSEEGAN